MIHYHGTPMGGSKHDAVRFLAGRHALIPFARPAHLRIALRVCKSVVLDNSAFTHWRAGHGEVDIEAYHQWVHGVADLAERMVAGTGRPSPLRWCLIPDAIDGGLDANVEMLTTWLRIGSRVKGVPVYHLDEPLDYLDYLVARFDTVALGSSGRWAMPGTASWWQRMDEVMRVACDRDGRPRAALHGLRMLDPDIFSRLPLVSADSTNAAVNSGAARAYVPPERWQRATNIAWRIEKHKAAPRWVSQGEQLAIAL